MGWLRREAGEWLLLRGVIIMLRKEVSRREAEGLKEEVNRVIEDHMLSFQQRAYLHYHPQEPHLDSTPPSTQLSSASASKNTTASAPPSKDSPTSHVPLPPLSLHAHQLPNH